MTTHNTEENENYEQRTQDIWDGKIKPFGTRQEGKHITVTTGMGVLHMDNYQNNDSDMININIVEDEDGECTIRASELLKMIQVFL